jgi:hypothetical protein
MPWIWSKRKQVLAIASGGGHWTQLRRLAPAFPEGTIWVSTNSGYAEEVPAGCFRRIPDADLWRKFSLIWMAFRVVMLVLVKRPTHVVTTGAAPGWFMVVFVRILGGKTLWIDSIANAETLSVSGAKARRWATEVWTQWPEVAGPAMSRKAEIQCRGGVL